MRVDHSKLTPREHVHVRGLGHRMAVLVLFTVFAVALVAVGAGLHVREAVIADTTAAAQRLVPVTQTLLNVGMDETNRAAAVQALSLSLPLDASFGLTDGRGTSLVRAPAGEVWVGKPLPEADLLLDMIAFKHGTLSTRGTDGTERLYAYAAILGPTGHADGYVYVGVPAATAFGTVRTATYRAAALGIPLVLLAIWAALTLADALVVRRIRKMVEQMRHVALGDSTDTTLIPGGLGELDELAQLFDKMRKRMVDATSDTDDKVRSRTADLEFNKGMAEFEQARTEALISSIGEAVIATDREGRIIFINQEVSHAMGWTPADLVGKKEEAVIVMQDDKEELLPISQRPTHIALATGQKSVLQAFPKPHWMVRKNGSTYPVQVTVTPVISGGNIIGAIEVVRDVTDETELDRRKTEFISIASHQLRSPLAATKWLSDMLRKGDLGKLTDKQQDIADKMFVANERMVVMVNELLNVSRLESGVSKPTPKETPTLPFLESLLSEAQPLLAEKKQKFAFTKGKLPALFIDALMIREVLMNLLSNASKYSPDGATITVTAAADEKTLQISIKDEGIGIPEADQGQLFKKFFRAGNALKSAVQGTGLGLYFVKSIIELSGGKIRYDSEENKGTTFYVTLPTV